MKHLESTALDALSLARLKRTRYYEIYGAVIERLRARGI